MLGLLAWALPAAAQPKAPPKAEASGPKANVLGTFEDWQALSYKESAGPVCYVASLPKKLDGHQAKAGEANILVTHWPAQKNIGVVSVTGGYEYKKDSDVELDIGSEKFQLFTRGNTAWARSGDDGKIVKAFKAGRDVVAHGVNGKGGKTADTYSLAGFSKAYEAASKACGVKG
jgi:hypothetical protein